MSVHDGQNTEIILAEKRLHFRSECLQHLGTSLHFEETPPYMHSTVALNGVNTKDSGLNTNAHVFGWTLFNSRLNLKKNDKSQEFLNDSIYFSSTTLIFQSVTATRWVRFTTGVTARASASVKMVPRGPSVTTVCQDTTGNKAVTVSIGRLTFDGFMSKNQEVSKCCSLPGPLRVHLPMFSLLPWE